MSHQIINTSACVLCGQKFTSEIGILSAGHETNGKDASLEAQVKELNRHLLQAHPNEWTAIGLYAENYVGFLRLQHFRHTDLRVLESLNKMRWHLHTQTCNATIPDEKILAKTGELTWAIAGKIHSTESEDADERARTAQILMDEFLPILLGFRNELQEPGKYPPLIGETTPLIVP